KLVTQDDVQVEQIEEQQACGRIEAPVGEQHRNVVSREGGEMESSQFIARVVLGVEQQVKSRQPFVRVLGGEVHPVIVVPERAHRLVHVAIGLVVGKEPGQDIGIVLIVEKGTGDRGG